MACGDEKHLTGSPGNDCCNLPDALLISSRLPTVVYIMVLTSAAMMASMVLINILVWSLPLRSILIIVVVCTCIVYII
ncbi:hypothetical protein ACOSQ3_027496 [Xanthoceras sorbifolium]